MNCRDAELLLLASRDGAPNPDQQALLDQHGLACPACQRLRTGLAAFRAETAAVAVPAPDAEWRTLQPRLASARLPLRKRLRAPGIWFAAPLAAAAALALAYIGWRPDAVQPAIGPAAEPAQAEYVDSGDSNASTLVYVDKESGWLVVWAADDDADTVKG